MEIDSIKIKPRIPLKDVAVAGNMLEGGGGRNRELILGLEGEKVVSVTKDYDPVLGKSFLHLHKNTGYDKNRGRFTSSFREMLSSQNPGPEFHIGSKTHTAYEWHKW